MRQPLPVLWALTVARPLAGALVPQDGKELTSEEALEYANRKRQERGEEPFASFAAMRAHYGLEG